MVRMASSFAEPWSLVPQVITKQFFEAMTLWSLFLFNGFAAVDSLSLVCPAAKKLELIAFFRRSSLSTFRTFNMRNSSQARVCGLDKERTERHAISKYRIRGL